MLPSTVSRVPEQTAEHVNRSIHQRLYDRVLDIASAGSDAVTRRLQELDSEWDTERTLETNASFIAFVGVLLGAFVDAWFLLLPGLVTVFLFQHALQGWCPPLPILRRLGFRTQFEIEQERYALKAIRGDFRDVSDPQTDFVASVDRALLAVAAETSLPADGGGVR